MSFNFNELNLSDAEVQTGGLMLKPGRYVVKVKDAKVGDTKNRDGGKVMTVQLEDTNGGGSITHWINVASRSAEAQRIGRNELKTLLHFGGHPNPDRPGDVALIKGLVVGCIVKPSKFTKNGVEKEGSEVGNFVDPADIDPAKYTPRPPLAQKQQAPSVNQFSDDIPF